MGRGRCRIRHVQRGLIIVVIVMIIVNFSLFTCNVKYIAQVIVLHVELQSKLYKFCAVSNSCCRHYRSSQSATASSTHRHDNHLIVVVAIVILIISQSVFHYHHNRYHHQDRPSPSLISSILLQHHRYTHIHYHHYHRRSTYIWGVPAVKPPLVALYRGPVEEVVGQLHELIGGLLEHQVVP